MHSGFKLTLPDDRIYEATSDAQVTHEQETSFVFDGFRNALALFEQYADEDGSSGGQKQSVYLGSGAGVHRISVEFVQYAGSDESWGNSSPNDSAISKRDEFDHALDDARITSENPATLEVGEYSTSGQFSPLKVVVKSSTLPYDPRNNASEFQGSLTFYVAADIQEAIHGQQQSPE